MSYNTVTAMQGLNYLVHHCSTFPLNFIRMLVGLQKLALAKITDHFVSVL